MTTKLKRKRMKIKIELELDTNDIDDSQALDDLLDIN